MTSPRRRPISENTLGDQVISQKIDRMVDGRRQGTQCASLEKIASDYSCPQIRGRFDIFLGQDR